MFLCNYSLDWSIYCHLRCLRASSCHSRRAGVYHMPYATTASQVGEPESFWGVWNGHRCLCLDKSSPFNRGAQQDKVLLPSTHLPQHWWQHSAFRKFELYLSLNTLINNFFDFFIHSEPLLTDEISIFKLWCAQLLFPSSSLSQSTSLEHLQFNMSASPF